MSHDINLRTPLKVIGGDGTKVIYTGSGILGFVYTCRGINADITTGMAVVMDAAGTRLQAENFGTGNTSLVIDENLISVRGSHSTTYNNGWIGVALQDIPVGSDGLVAGLGSIVPVLVAASTGTLGQHANATTTAGTVISAAAAPANPANSLGLFMKPSGAASPTGGFTDTGSNNRAFVLVTPHSA